MYKKIKDYDNYQICDDGTVVNIITNKILKGSISESGYKYYRLSKNNNKKMFFAHRLVAEAFLPNPNNLPVVNHKDGNKLNNQIDNLEWVTYSENVEHAHQTSLISSYRKREYYTKDLQDEEWKKIKNFPYSVSSLGRIRNDRTNLLLKPSIANGYYKVRLSYNNQILDQTIHNIVYCTFFEIEYIPEGYVVNHKDANKLNNNIKNLELITLSENVYKALYETKTNSNCKKVKQFDKQHNYIATYNSTREAARELNLDSSTISKVCRGKVKSHGGYLFEYSE